MKRLFKKIFKKESQLKYIIAEYQPIETNPLRTDSEITEHNLDKPANIDQMQIDKIYQSL